MLVEQRRKTQRVQHERGLIGGQRGHARRIPRTFSVVTPTVFVTGGLGIRCNRRPICVGIRLALCRDVEPHDSKETPAPATTSNDAETRPKPDPAAAPATPQAAAGGRERPAMNWSLILVGIVGLCLGSVIVFAFGQVSADEPPDVAPAVARSEGRRVGVV